jgi:hypothetical protein
MRKFLCLPVCPGKTPDKTPAELHIAVLMFNRDHRVADLDEVRKELGPHLCGFGLGRMDD